MPLVLAGDSVRGDDYPERLRALAGTDPRIRFTGFVYGDLWRALLSHAYLFVHPSESEGLSIGLLESMAFGNCVLVSDVPENLEVVGDFAGACFRSRDAGDLRRALAALIADSAEVEGLRRRARTHVGLHFDWEKIVDAYERVYREVLG
jgi:glycosyltransferase involved in cell wall biosynthesis